jgi:hypothetical protein
MAATTRKEIIKGLINDFKTKFNSLNGYMDLSNVYRGTVFLEEAVPSKSLAIDFSMDSPVTGDFLDNNAIRTLTLMIQGLVNTSYNDYEIFDDVIENVETFLRSEDCSYEVEIGQVRKIEATQDVSNSFFTIEISILYDRQY